MVANDFSAHDLVKDPLQVYQFQRQRFQLLVRDDAHAGIFKRDSVTGVTARADAVQAQQFPRHLKAGHLVASVFQSEASFEKPSPYRIKRLKLVSGSEQRIAPDQGLSGADQLIEAVHLVRGHAHREAQFTQIARRAMSFEGFEANGDGSHR
jgi:hypothetical protein